MASLRTIEAKLDALLEAQGIDPAEVVKTPPPPKPRELSAAEQQAIANAPAVTPVVGPRNARTTATNAPDVSASTPTESQGIKWIGFDGLDLTPDQEQALADAGYTDRAALAAASDDDLVAVPTVGRATVASLRRKLE